jgi:hypothetical protein
MDPEQNIVAEGLDEEDEDMSEEDNEEGDDEYDDEYESVDEDDDMEKDNEEDQADEDDDSILVTAAMLKEWTTAANRKSPAAWKKMLMAFRSFVRSDEASKTKFTYRVESSKGTNSFIFQLLDKS